MCEDKTRWFRWPFIHYILLSHFLSCWETAKATSLLQEPWHWTCGHYEALVTRLVKFTQKQKNFALTTNRYVYKQKRKRFFPNSCRSLPGKACYNLNNNMRRITADDSTTMKKTELEARAIQLVYMWSATKYRGTRRIASENICSEAIKSLEILDLIAVKARDFFGETLPQKFLIRAIISSLYFRRDKYVV